MNTEHLYQIYLKHPVICTDTRKISQGCLFFALKGDNFDGNKFAKQAIEQGAAFSIVDNPEFAVDERFILVGDVLQALQDLARFHRRKLEIPVIGITGTNGKTTTKELIRSVLSRQFNTFATEGNLNNHIGVPISILSIKNECEIAIIEMGANHQKEIEFLCSISLPTHGLITNVGKAHLEGFGGVEGVKKGKGELYEFLLASGGQVFINSNDETLKKMAEERGLNNIIGYGKAPENFITARLKETDPFLIVEWNKGGGESYLAMSHLPGTYNFDNICAAICIGSFFGMDAVKINEGIYQYKPVNNRSQIVKTALNTVICDYYNANPSSMLVALDNLISTKSDNKVLILGDMFELGQEAEQEHRMILDKAMSLSASRRIMIGEEFFKLADNSDAEFYRNTSYASEALQKNPIKNATVLLKGSRGMKLENLLDLL